MRCVSVLAAPSSVACSELLYLGRGTALGDNGPSVRAGRDSGKRVRTPMFYRPGTDLSPSPLFKGDGGSLPHECSPLRLFSGKEL